MSFHRQQSQIGILLLGDDVASRPEAHKIDFAGNQRRIGLSISGKDAHVNACRDPALVQTELYGLLKGLHFAQLFRGALGRVGGKAQNLRFVGPGLADPRERAGRGQQDGSQSAGVAGEESHAVSILMAVDETGSLKKKMGGTGWKAPDFCNSR